MALRPPSSFIAPRLPSRAARPPSGPLWVHEIKHDGYRLLVRRDGARVRCFTRNGYDWAGGFPSIVEAALLIKATSFLIDGEVVIARDDEMSHFRALRSRSRSRGNEAVLYAFDLIEKDGEDLRDLPLIGSGGSRDCSARPSTPAGSRSIWRLTVRPCSPTSAAWGWRASCRSGRMRRGRTRRGWLSCGARRGPAGQGTGRVGIPVGGAASASRL